MHFMQSAGKQYSWDPQLHCLLFQSQLHLGCFARSGRLVLTCAREVLSVDLLNTELPCTSIVTGQASVPSIAVTVH